MGARNNGLSDPCQADPTICKKCGQPILAESTSELEAGFHRFCLRREVGQELINGRAHILWLQAYALLCKTLGYELAKTTIIPLALRYRDCMDPRSYLEFLSLACSLVEKLPLSQESAKDLTEQVIRIKGLIQALLSDNAN